MKNNKLIISILSVLLLSLIGCVSKGLGVIRVLRLNETEFQELKKISVEDHEGFKVIKTSLSANKFKELSTSKKNKSITKEDERKIRDILAKY